jgi:hypothetical protein
MPQRGIGLQPTVAATPLRWVNQQTNQQPQRGLRPFRSHECGAFDATRLEMSVGGDPKDRLGAGRPLPANAWFDRHRRVPIEARSCPESLPIGQLGRYRRQYLRDAVRLNIIWVVTSIRSACQSEPRNPGDLILNLRRRKPTNKSGAQQKKRPDYFRCLHSII